MEPYQRANPPLAGTPAAAGRSLPEPSRTFDKLLPLAALGFTTLLLALSAIRVVASSLGRSGSTDVAPPRIVLKADKRVPIVAAEPSAVDESFDDAMVAMVEPPSQPAPAPTPTPKPATDEAPPPPSPVAPGETTTFPPRPNPKMTLFRGAMGYQSFATAQKSDRPPPPVASKSTAKKTDKPALDPPKEKPAPRPPAPKPEAKRILVRDGDGKVMVTRVHGQDGNKVAVFLPDGRIGWPDGLAYTDQPFVPETKDEVKDKLGAKEFAGFNVITSKHYVVFYKCSPAFAHASTELLEDLYKTLSKALDKRAVPVHEAEFPLVAVIFRTEEEFRRYKPVAPEVQAYYDIMSNRIFLYEKSSRDQMAPEVSALRKPQTVAHEGTHQILANIGVHPRLADWPPWLIEGLAEYCASSKLGKNGVPIWAGLGNANVIHIATIRDLSDPLSTRVPGAEGPVIARDPKTPIVQYLATKVDLTPTDYALSWALTYFLAYSRTDDFLDYLRDMSQLEPFVRKTPEEHLKRFKAAFGENLVKLDGSLSKFFNNHRQSDAMPYYAVMFEQAVGGGRLKRAAMVSQSPLIIRQWIENNTSPRGAEPVWRILQHPSKARALITAQEWMGGNG